MPGREYALVFVTAAIVTFLVTGGVRWVAIRIGAMTPIRERDVHRTPTPRMGGVAVYLGVAAAVLMAMHLPKLRRAFESSTEIKGVLVAGAVIVLVGVLDDRFDLDSITKLAGQVLAAGILVLFGVQWLQMWVPADVEGGGQVVTFDQVQGALITVLLTLILTNAMNFIDGLDGLLAGVVLISAAGLFVFSSYVLVLSQDDAKASQAPLIAAAIVGACIGFLPYNFFRAKIFMGDSGSMFVGLAMAAATVSVSGKFDLTVYGGPRSTIAMLSPLIVMVAVVFIPLLDFALAVLRRTREGRHPFSADKRHLHHRMLNLGHSHRAAVLVFYLWALVICAGAVSLAFVSWRTAALPFGAGVVVAVVATAWPWIRARRLGRDRRDRAAADAALGETSP